MRPPKTTAYLAPTLVLFQATGCYSFRPLEGDSLTAWKPKTCERVVLVTLRDRSSLRLARPTMDSVTIRGVVQSQVNDPDPRMVTIPLRDVEQVYERRPDFWDSIALTTVLGIGVYCLVIALTNSGEG